MADTTTKPAKKATAKKAAPSTPASTETGHAAAVKAVTGQNDDIETTRDLKSEQDADAKLDKEAGKVIPAFTSTLDGPERKQRAVRTLPNGKTEAVLEEPEPLPVFPPDDGGYNPEKRTHAGPGGTKVPSAVGKNDTTQDSDLIAAGWKPSHIKEKAAK